MEELLNTKNEERRIDDVKADIEDIEKNARALIKAYGQGVVDGKELAIKALTKVPA